MGSGIPAQGDRGTSDLVTYAETWSPISVITNNTAVEQNGMKKSYLFYPWFCKFVQYLIIPQRTFELHPNNMNNKIRFNR